MVSPFPKVSPVKTKPKTWAQRAALTIYKDLEVGVPLERDVKKIVLGYWARVIQQAHDGYNVGKRDRAAAGA